MTTDRLEYPALAGVHISSVEDIGEFSGYDSTVYTVSYDGAIVVIHGVEFLVHVHEDAIDLSRRFGAYNQFRTTWLSETDQYLIEIVWTPIEG